MGWCLRWHFSATYAEVQIAIRLLCVIGGNFFVHFLFFTILRTKRRRVCHSVNLYLVIRTVAYLVYSIEQKYCYAITRLNFLNQSFFMFCFIAFKMNKYYYSKCLTHAKFSFNGVCENANPRNTTFLNWIHFPSIKHKNHKYTRSNLVDQI